MPITTYYPDVYGQGVQITLPSVGIDYGFYGVGPSIPTLGVVTSTSTAVSSASLDYSIAANSQYIPLLIP